MKDKIIKNLPENVGLGLLVGSAIAQSEQLPEPAPTITKVVLGAAMAVKVASDVLLED